MTNKRRPRGTLKLVQPIVEAAPKPTKKVTQAAVKSSSKGPQSLSLAWDENEGMGQARDQRPLSEYERKDTLYRVYEGNTWVSACVDVISKRFTSGGWHLEEVEHGKGQQDTHDRLKSFLLNINDDEDFLQFLRSVADDLNIYGEAYAEIILGADGLPFQLVSVDCPTMTYQLDEHGNILGYTQMLTQSNKKIQFKPEQIIRWWFPSKRAKKVGFSPLQKMVNPTYADKSMVDWSHMFFRKGTKPSAWVELGPESDMDDARLMVKFYRENYTGEQNAHVPVIMWGGAKLNEYGKGPVDIDFHNGRVFSREEILAGYGVPPAAIGIIESGNIGGGSGEDQDKSLRNNTVDPIKQLILEKFNRRIVQGVFGIPDWIVTTKYADYRSDSEIVKIQQTRIFSGISTPDEERQDSGKTPYPDGIGSTPILISGREILPLERMGELADEQRQTASVTLKQQTAQAEMAEIQTEKAKEPPQPVPAPLQAPGAVQPPHQKAPPVAPQAQPKESTATLDTSTQQDDWLPDNLDKRLAEYRDQGVEYLKWLCQSNACDLCFANDGEVRQVGSPFPNNAIIPQCHPNCECSVEPTEKPKED